MPYHPLSYSFLFPGVTGTTRNRAQETPAMPPTERSHHNLRILKFSSLFKKKIIIIKQKIVDAVFPIYRLFHLALLVHFYATQSLCNQECLWRCPPPPVSHTPFLLIACTGPILFNLNL